jgi:hypothetical protein
MTELDEKNLDQLEDQIPLHAEELVRRTYEEAIRSGKSVVVSSDGALFRVDLSGRTKIKDIAKGSFVLKTKIKLR